MKNNNFKPLTKREEWLSEQIVDAAYCVHKKLGPGLLEKVNPVWEGQLLSHLLFRQ